MTAQTRRVLLIAAAFLGGLVSVLAVVLAVVGFNPFTPQTAPSAIGGPFSLTAHDGRRVTDADIKGRPALVFFGFTHCPDVCPTALFEVSEVLRALGPDADRARGLFITVDPERDTPQTLASYLGSFDPRLLGLTGTPEEVAGVLKAYRVYSRKVPTENGGYTMDHTALVYLMDKQGRFVAPFNLKRKPEEAAAELRKYL